MALNIWSRSFPVRQRFGHAERGQRIVARQCHQCRALHHGAELARHALGRLQRALWIDEGKRLQCTGGTQRLVAPLRVEIDHVIDERIGIDARPGTDDGRLELVTQAFVRDLFAGGDRAVHVALDPDDGETLECGAGFRGRQLENVLERARRLSGRLRNGRFDAEPVRVDLRRGAEDAGEPQAVVADDLEHRDAERQGRVRIEIAKRLQCAARVAARPGREKRRQLGGREAQRARKSRRRRRVDLRITREQRLERETPSFEIRQGRDLRGQGFERAAVGFGGEAEQGRTLGQADGLERERQEIDGARRELAGLRRSRRVVRPRPGKPACPSRRRRRARNTSRRRPARHRLQAARRHVSWPPPGG